MAALIVEDGSIVPNANSYASVADADNRLLARGNPDWDALDSDVKQQSLIKATDYVTFNYRLLWAGYRVSPTQPLDWPRYQVPQVDGPGQYSPFPYYYASNVVPPEVKNATIDLALRSSQGVDLMADLGPPVIQETVGPITTKYAAGARQFTEYVAVDGLLSAFLKTGGGYSISLQRG